jgi:hypothetical protein
VSADVFFGDRRLGPGDSRVTIERTGDSPDVVLRVRTRSPVDEPVVTVFLQAGCDLASTRRYVFLAEPPSLLEGSSTPAAAVAAASSATAPGGTVSQATAVPAPPVGGSVGPTSNTERSGPRKPSRERRDSSAADVAVRASQPVALAPSISLRGDAQMPARGRSTEAAKVVSRPKLKLDPIDIETDRPLGLKSSPILTTELAAESPDIQARRRAARDLWLALNSTPEAWVTQRQSLEDATKQINTMSRKVAQTEQRAVQAEAATETAKAERFRNPLVYFLAAVVVVLGALLAWVVSRRRSPQAWWQGNEAVEHFPTTHGDLSARPTGPGRPSVSGAPATLGDPRKASTWRRKLWSRQPPAAQTLEPDDDSRPFASRSAAESSANSRPKGRVASESESLPPEDGMTVEMFTTSNFDQSLVESRTEPKARTASPRESLLDDLDGSAGGAGRRSVNVEELLDVHQQVEFFATLGEFSQAAELLRVQLEVAPDSSALLYLDLLDLYRKSGNQDEYEETKLALERRFAVQAPDWGEDSAHGRNLEDYEQAIHRIMALWPSPKVLGVIEESLMRRPESPEQAFDLPAYRELLMLYSVASSILDSGTSHGKSQGKAAAAVEEIRSEPSVSKMAADSLAVTDGSVADAGDVDLLLDFDDSPQAEAKTGFRNTQIEPLQASPGTVVDSEPPEHLGLDLDLSVLDVQAPEQYPAETAESSASTPGPSNNLIDFDFDVAPAPPKPMSGS